MFEEDEEFKEFVEISQQEMDGIYSEFIYEEVLEGKYVEEFGIIDAIEYFSKKEEYEKCIILKKTLNK